VSLINEALRKARKDAAERDAESKGVTYRPPRAHLPAERPWLGALVGGIAVGILAAGLAFVLLRPPADAEPAPISIPQQELPVQELPVPAAEPLAQTEPSAEEVAEEVAEPAPEPPPEPKPDTASAAQPEAPVALPESEATSATSQVKSRESKRIRPPEQVGKIDDEVYVLEAEKDGVSLRLDFIVWAPPNPFAQINGRQVSIGQTVDGFLVRAIEREAVTLEGDDGPFRLRVR
jgi:hypothetical protein